MSSWRNLPGRSALALALAIGFGVSHAAGQASGAAPVEVEVRAANASAELPIPEPTGRVALEDALALALIKSPELDMFSWDTRASEARELQAGKRPNPELDVRVYRLGIPRQSAELDETRTRVMVSQTLELGGKRRRRIDLAQTERHLSELDYETMRSDVAAAVTRRFVSVLGAQRTEASLRSYVEFFERMRDRVRGLVETGSMRSLEIHQATRRVGLARIEHQSAESALAAARYSLAASWGGTSPQFTEAVGDLEPLRPIPALEAVMDLARRSPAVARWDAELARGEAELDLAEAGRIPDFNVGTGVRWQDDFDDRDYVVDVEVTLPIFDRKQGDIQEARHRIERARAGREAEQASRSEIVAELYYSLVESRARGVTLGDEVIPAARSTFEALELGHEQGVASLGDLLDARRDLARAEVQQTEALVSYHQARAALEGILGQELDGLE